MANDFKPATDRSINDVNRMNQDAWDSGEFRHQSSDDWSNEQAKNAHFMNKRLPEGPLTKAQNSHAEEVSERHETLKGKPLGEKMKRRVAIAEHSQNDKQVHLPRTSKRTWKNGVWS